MKEEIYITRGLSISKKFFTLLWMFFCLISIAVGIKMQNLVISMAIIVGIPVLFYLMKVPKKLIYAEIIYVLLIRVFITIFKIVPQSAMYVTDIFNLIAFIIALSKYLTNRKSKINVKLPVIIVISMLLFSIIGLIINGQSILLFMWGIRNTYRFFAFIFSCIVLLEKEDVNKLLKILNKVFILNLILCLYQYIILHLHQDYIGGIFGIEIGANGYTNIYLIIMYTYALTGFMYKESKLSQLVLITIGSLVIAAISELKGFYIEFIVITVIGILFSRFNKRIFILLIVALFTIYSGLQILYMIYPNFEGFLQIDYIIGGSAKETASGRLNRLNAIEYIDETFLTDKTKKAFGLGMGSAEISNVATFNSSFAEKYNEILRYSWYSDAFMFLENGYVGLSLYVLFFIAILYDSIKLKRKNNDKRIFTIVEILVPISVFLIWYNASLRSEPAYLLYFVLSIGYIYNKNNNILEETNK